jgi:hypothetical protein
LRQLSYFKRQLTETIYDNPQANRSGVSELSGAGCPVTQIDA